MHAGRWEILKVASGEPLSWFKELASEYVSSLPFELDFEDFARELRELPGDYAPPGGLLIVAVWDGNPAGCVALRPFDGKTCEMKRMYVRPEFRGHGLGRAIAERAVAEARRIGYEKMRLDTVASLKEANRMYEGMGFREIAPYRHNPRPDARYFELTLAPL